MSTLERLAIEILLLLIVVAGFAMWERHKGATRCEAADAAAVAKQEAHNAAITLNQNQSIANEKKAYEDALLQPIASPVVRLCFAPHALPQTPATATSAHAKVPSGKESASNLIEGPDIGKPLLTVGHTADATIAGLQDYIMNVCLK